MTIADTNTADARLFRTLNGIPEVDIATNRRAALAAGRRVTSILREIIALRRGAGRLTPPEYFYYRLWDPEMAPEEKRRFVGKLAQHRMHTTANDRHWFQTAADKILFHTIMAGAQLPVPDLLAATHAVRISRGSRSCSGDQNSTRSSPSRWRANTASPC